MVLSKFFVEQGMRVDVFSQMKVRGRGYLSLWVGRYAAVPILGLLRDGPRP